MKNMSADTVKWQLRNLGADLCGIASLERFNDAPPGFHPRDIVACCKSVIVIAVKFPTSILAASSLAAYSFSATRLFEKVDSITFQAAIEFESLGCCAIPTPASGPYDYWDNARRHGQGILSLKHAAVRAGLGQLGNNTLLVNKALGNMLVLGAILIDKELEADPLADYQSCIPGCRICIDACPAKALDGTTIDQSKCREVSTKSSEGGGGVYACMLCRKLCPNHRGLRLDIQ